MRFLDANIILRYLTCDDEAKAKRCYTLFQKLQQGEEEVITTEAIITEVVYVLSARSVYKLSHEEVRARLVPILNLRGLKLLHKRRYLRALDIYVSYPFLDFGDALTVALMEGEGLAEVYSYDTDFDRLPEIKRVEP